MKRILVLCTGNSCRSQMAHGYLKKIGGDKVEVKSAGIEAHGLNPRAVEVMREVGIDISGHTSNTIEEYSNETFDYVLTVCDNAKERCPFFPAKSKLVHHNFPDPAAAKGTENEILMAFRSTRDQIEAYCQNFISTTVVG
ncbi:MAG: arsenate reductase ArsC [Cyclobacteriaceae bacterium]